MAGTCCVKTCKSHLRKNLIKEKVSLFKAPNQKELWDKWEAVLKIFNVTLKKSNYVCEKHFLPEEIKRVYKKKDAAGNFFLENLKAPRLMKGAVPSLFEWDESCKMPNETDNDEFIVESEELKSKNQNKNLEENETEICETENDITDFEEYEESPCLNKDDNLCNLPNTTKKEKKTLLSLNYAVAEKGQIIHHLFVKEVLSNNDENESETESSIDNISEKEMDIYDHKVNLNNENIDFSSPLIHKIELPEDWIMSKNNSLGEIAFVKLSQTCTDLTLFVEKQIILRNNNIISIQILNKSIKLFNQMDPRTIGELENLIQLINDAKLCEGGPGENEYPNLMCDTAYVDQAHKWRHQNCDLIISDGTNCKKCTELFEIFSNHAEKNLMNEDIYQIDSNLILSELASPSYS